MLAFEEGLTMAALIGIGAIAPLSKSAPSRCCSARPRPLCQEGRHERYRDPEHGEDRATRAAVLGGVSRAPAPSC